MRVVFCSELFWPNIGGAEVFASNLLASLRERGHEIILVTRKDSADLPSEAQYQGLPIYRFPFALALDRRSVDQVILARQGLARLKRAFAPDLVHIQGFGPSVVYHLDTMQSHPAPLLVTLIEERQQPEGRELLTRMLRSADWMTGKSSAVLAQARRLAPEITPRSSIIYNGLQVPDIVPEPLFFESPRLLCLGRLATQKGFDLAITAMASIAGRFPHARMIVAGDGPERAALERQAADLGLAHAVGFLGWVSPDKVFALINASTTVIMPSRWEGLPSVVLQAAMMARPVVGARVSGISEVIVHEETGLLVEPEDGAGLAAAIALLLERPEAAVRMGQAARVRVQETFSWEQCVSAYDALWRRLVLDWRGRSSRPSV
jgi:glycosyltransferase involved in cell wall biosynthesis